MSSPSARLSGHVVPETKQYCWLASRYAVVRAETERLTKGLSAEDQCIQSMPDASPAKWHRAHTTWFFETFVLSHDPSYRVFDDRYAFMFNSYYEAVGPRHERSMRGLLARPSADEIGVYREYVDAAMHALLEQRGNEPAIASLTELGLQHEQQHQELLLTDILHALAQNPLLPAFMPFVPAEATTRTPRAFRHSREASLKSAMRSVLLHSTTKHLRMRCC